MTYLALLRGINVSGHHIIKMDVLVKMMQQIGFHNVNTYIQSGNVFFETDNQNPQSISFTIKQEIYKQFGYDVPVIIVTQSSIQKCLANNPFLKEKNIDTKKLYVAFISKKLDTNAINDLKTSQFKPDEAVIDEDKIYLKLETGAGKTKLTQKYIEKKLHVEATTRSWNTILNLLELYKKH